jgi:hypothetical protein
MGHGYGRPQSDAIDTRAHEAELAGRCIRAQSPEEGKCLRRRVHDGILVSPGRGLFARKDYWDSLPPSEQTLHVMRSISDLHGTWVFRQAAAGVAHGLEVPLTYPDELLSTKRHERGGGLIIRRRDSMPTRTAIASGVCCTSLDRTLFDCLSELEFPRALAVADSYLRNQGLQVDSLREELRRSFHGLRRGAESLERALGIARWADPSSENGGESYARAVMLSLGFAAPQLQVVIPDILDADHAYRADFCWFGSDGGLILGELDGLAKYYRTDMTSGRPIAEVMSRERLRESRISLLGARVIRFSFRDVLDTDRFRLLLTRAGVPRR